LRKSRRFDFSSERQSYLFSQGKQEADTIVACSVETLYGTSLRVSNLPFDFFAALLLNDSAFFRELYKQRKSSGLLTCVEVFLLV
jgi:hypothetical protein